MGNNSGVVRKKGEKREAVRKCPLSIYTRFDMDVFWKVSWLHLLIFFILFMGRPCVFYEKRTADNGKEKKSEFQVHNRFLCPHVLATSSIF